jgi:hypothetical protein
MDFVTELTGAVQFISVGHSGGATLTAYLTAIDDRVITGIPVHYVTTFLELLEHNTAAPGDHEQSLFGFLAEGFDMADYLWMAAPKPVPIHAAEHDFFPIRGTRRTYDQAQRLYAMFGAEKKLQLCAIPVDHTLNKEVREPIYSYLSGKDVTEAEWPVYPDEVLYCSADGDIWSNANPPLDFLRQMIRKDGAAFRCNKSAIREWLASSLRLHDPKAFTPKGQTILNHHPQNERLLVLCDPQGLTDRWDLDLLCASGYNVLKSEVWQQELIRSVNAEPPPITYSEDMRLALYAAVCGEQVMGIRLRQCFAVLDEALKTLTQKPKEIILFGSGLGGIMMNITALFYANIRKIINVNTLWTYRQLFNDLNYHYESSSTIYGMLQRFDLDDIAETLQPVQLTLVNPIGEVDGGPFIRKNLSESFIQSTDFILSELSEV